MIDGKTKHLGRYETEEDAARAYDKKAFSTWGVYTYLNFPNEIGTCLNEMFVFLVPGSKFIVNRAPLLGIYPAGTEVQYHGHIDIRTVSGEISPWQPSQVDMLSEDWIVI